MFVDSFGNVESMACITLTYLGLTSQLPSNHWNAYEPINVRHSKLPKTCKLWKCAFLYSYMNPAKAAAVMSLAPQLSLRVHSSCLRKGRHPCRLYSVALSHPHIKYTRLDVLQSFTSVQRS